MYTHAHMCIHVCSTLFFFGKGHPFTTYSISARDCDRDRALDNLTTSLEPSLKLVAFSKVHTRRITPEYT